jgi:hypothetical protein
MQANLYRYHDQEVVARVDVPLVDGLPPDIVLYENRYFVSDDAGGDMAYFECQPPFDATPAACPVRKG